MGEWGIGIGYEENTEKVGKRGRGESRVRREGGEGEGGEEASEEVGEERERAE